MQTSLRSREGLPGYEVTKVKRQGATSRPRADVLSVYSRHELGGSYREESWNPGNRKTKEQRISPLLPGLYPPPGTSPNSNYCSCGHAALAQTVFTTTGVPPAPCEGLKWMTPSSFEQNERTPLWLKAAGAPPTVYCRNGAAAEALVIAK